MTKKYVSIQENILKSIILKILRFKINKLKLVFIDGRMELDKLQINL